MLPLSVGPILAEDRAPTASFAKGDKSPFNLFNPTPPPLLRQMSADRPDKTDSAFTVDAGHFQVEMDFANFTYDRYNHEHSRISGFEISPMNLKVGLFNNLDAQLVLSPYRWLHIEDTTTHTVVRKSGFGDVTPRLKLNLVGNDGGAFALALMPFVKLPTSQDHLGNRSVEGGLKVPYSLDVPDWDVAAQTEIDIIHSAGSSYHPEFINSLSIGRSVLGKLSYYVEFFTNVSAEAHSDWVGTFDTWLSYELNENLRLDAGVYLGVTRAAEDWHPFAGMSVRF